MKLKKGTAKEPQLPRLNKEEPVAHHSLEHDGTDTLSIH